MSHHRVDVPEVAVDGDRVVHRRLGMGQRVVRSQGRGYLTVMVDEGEVDEASRARRWCTTSLPPVHGGDHDTNAAVTVSQDSRPTRYNYNGSRKSRGVVWFF
jgi:hypothetical protein